MARSAAHYLQARGVPVSKLGRGMLLRLDSFYPQAFPFLVKGYRDAEEGVQELPEDGFPANAYRLGRRVFADLH